MKQTGIKQKKTWRWKPTMYGILVLLVLLGTALNLWRQGENPLLDKKTAITLYREAYVGQRPEFRTEDFFAEERIDYEKVTYDTSSCDFDKAGVYRIPVYYDGQETNCEVELTIKNSETESVAWDGTVLRGADGEDKEVGSDGNHIDLRDEGGTGTENQ